MIQVLEAKKEGFSKTLQQMLQTRIGYRDETFSGSGERNAFKVIDFETEELLNEDIPDFVKKFYGIQGKEELFQKLKEHFETDDLVALWLTTKKGVLSN
ncbi:MAG: hypothetical protein ACH0QD_13205 [Tepidibacillus sp.]